MGKGDHDKIYPELGAVLQGDSQRKHLLSGRFVFSSSPAALLFCAQPLAPPPPPSAYQGHPYNACNEARSVTDCGILSVPDPYLLHELASFSYTAATPQLLANTLLGRYLGRYLGRRLAINILSMAAARVEKSLLVALTGKPPRVRKRHDGTTALSLPLYLSHPQPASSAPEPAQCDPMRLSFVYSDNATVANWQFDVDLILWLPGGEGRRAETESVAYFAPLRLGHAFFVVNPIVAGDDSGWPQTSSRSFSANSAPSPRPTSEGTRTPKSRGTSLQPSYARPVSDVGGQPFPWH